MTAIINTKLGEHRGKRRVWLEGQKLAREKFYPGVKYDVEFKAGRAVLKASATGKYTVSRRERNGRISPIIDLTANELAELFDGVQMLRVTIREGKIVVSAHHQEQLIKDRVDRLVAKLESYEPLSVSSLFHGAGVLDKAIHKGFWDAGIDSKIAVAVELEGKYLETSLSNNPELWGEDSVAIESPIQAVNINRNPPQVDIVVGGIPCTGASLAGRSKNKLQYAESHDAAGAMFFNFLEFVKVLNPAIVLLENVPSYGETASMVVIRSVLSSLGYNLQEAIFDGNEFGALENRKRLCVVAVSKGIDGFDIHGVTPVQRKESTLSEVLESIPHDSDRWKSFDYLAEKEQRDKAAGKGFRRQLLTGEEAFCGVIGRGYAKARSTEPFIVHPNNPKLSRLLTPAEHCRVKKIPESVIDGLSDTVAHEVLGQSVIFPVFEAVAKELGMSLWRQLGLTSIQVEVFDSEQSVIGGEDFHWAHGVVDDNGVIKPTSAAKELGMPVHFVGDSCNEIRILDPNGSDVAAHNQPCTHVAVEITEDDHMKIVGGRERVASALR